MVSQNKLHTSRYVPCTEEVLVGTKPVGKEALFPALLPIRPAQASRRIRPPRSTPGEPPGTVTDTPGAGYSRQNRSGTVTDAPGGYSRRTARYCYR